MKHIFLLLILFLCCLLTGIVCAEVPRYGNWTKITNNVTFGERQDFGSASFDNRLWVIGGVDDQSNIKNDVWSSSDGIQWDLITSNASFSPRASSGVSEFNHYLWIIGGATKDKLLNDVWSSSDGKTWELVTSNANFSPRGHMGITVFDNRLWVIGGDVGWGTYANDVWSSVDGKNWELVTGNAIFSPRSGQGVAVFDDRLWVIGGSETNDVWSSKDGNNWILVNANAPFKVMEYTPVVVFDNKFWIVGGGSYPPAHSAKRVVERAYDEIWSSPDGNNWTLETEHAGFGPRFLQGVTVFKNRIWMIEGIGDHAKDVWYMPALNPGKIPDPELISGTDNPSESRISITTTKAGINLLIVCVSLCIAVGFCGWYGRRRFR
jgi:hypothetical protein